jgi:hypothetical protein
VRDWTVLWPWGGWRLPLSHDLDPADRATATPEDQRESVRSVGAGIMVPDDQTRHEDSMESRIDRLLKTGDDCH